MAKTTPRTDALKEYTVVDTDVHLRVPIEKVVPYMEEPFKTRADQGQIPSDSWNRYKTGRIERKIVDSAEDLEEGLCRRLGIDHPIINATVPQQPRISDPDYAHALVEAHNDYLIDNVLDANEDFFGLAQVATQDPEAAAEEIDRVGQESQIVGVYVIPMGADTLLGDERFDVIYEAAEDNDLTIAFHPHGTVSAVDFPKQYYAFNKYISVHTLGFVWGQMQVVVSLLERGTPVKFPDLNFTFLEGDIGWVPGLMYRLNKEYSARRDELPHLEKSPEQYVKDFYFASQPIGEPDVSTDMHHLLEAINAPNTVMFSSDYPHWDFDNPSEIFRYLDAHCSEEEKRQILSENAVDAYDLNI